MATMMRALVAMAAAGVAEDAAASTCERGLAIARRSRCPSSRWKDTVGPALVDGGGFGNGSSSGPLVYVNAGANKGFAVAVVGARGP